MNNLAEQVGRPRFVQMLQKASEKAAGEAVGKTPISPERRNLAAWIAPVKQGSPLYEHALVMKVVKDTPAEFAIKVTECLWAKTFRAKGAADIGYAMICHPDFAAATAFSSKVKMIRTKTLMQGADSCDHRYVAV